MSDRPAASPWPVRRRLGAWLLVAALCFLAGAWIGRLLPPFVVDGTFVRDFLTSAGFGGCMAVVAAAVAFFGVRYSTRRAARSAAETLEQRNISDAREHYWTRFTYAVERALSDSDAESTFGLLLLLELADQDWMSLEDNRVALAVSEVILGGRSAPGSAASDEGSSDDRPQS